MLGLGKQVNGSIRDALAVRAASINPAHCHHPLQRRYIFFLLISSLHRSSSYILLPLACMAVNTRIISRHSTAHITPFLISQLLYEAATSHATSIHSLATASIMAPGLTAASCNVRSPRPSPKTVHLSDEGAKFSRVTVGAAPSPSFAASSIDIDIAAMEVETRQPTEIARKRLAELDALDSAARDAVIKRRMEAQKELEKEFQRSSNSFESYHYMQRNLIQQQ